MQPLLAKKKSSVLSLRKNVRDSGGRRKYEERARFQERVMGERKSGFRAKRGLFKVQLSFWPHKEIFERQREPSRGSRDRKRPLNRSEGDQRKGEIERALLYPRTGPSSHLNTKVQREVLYFSAHRNFIAARKLHKTCRDTNEKK